MTSRAADYSSSEDSDFFKETAYSNDAEYIRKNLERNIELNELKGKTVLDYGCGIGDASFQMANHGSARIDAIDIGEKNIRLAIETSKQEKRDNIQFVCADLNTYQLKPNAYDLVWSDTVIELLRKPLPEVFRQFHETLRPDGILYCSFTRKTFFNIVLYQVLKVLKFFGAQRFKKLFLVLILWQYRVAALFGSKQKIDKVQTEAKLDYLFIPHVNLISEKEARAALKQSNFKILYIRERMKSDVNSPAHLEFKAVKEAASSS